MLLSQLLSDIKLTSEFDKQVKNITLDSRAVKPGDTFVALQGMQQDGRRYIPDAITRGATVVLLEADSEDELPSLQHNIPFIPIYQLQHKLGAIAARFYDYPTKKLRMIGVTGTNGKTSCTHFIAQCLQFLQQPCGIIGTLGSGFYGALNETGYTTPDAITLQATFATLLQQHAQAIAMEVSSHSIDQGRVNDIAFEVGVFTNLTQDHLDYHGTMHAYAAVKKRFLTEFDVRQLVINADDPYGKRWLAELSSRKPLSYSTTSPIADVYVDQTQLTLQGMSTHIHTPWGKAEVSLPLIGLFNLSNVLAVVATLGALGVSFADILRAIQTMRSVPGRMQLLGGGQKQPLVVVDYAHTPDALQNALQALRAHTQGKLVCVFGCGGDRDKGKRPLMAKIAEQMADQVIVTNDNPRHEDPEVIAAQIQAGFSQPQSVHIELDRSKAIQNSIQWSKAADCILIAGKGAERYQQIGDQKLPFDDTSEVMRYLGVSVVTESERL